MVDLLTTLFSWGIILLLILSILVLAMGDNRSGKLKKELDKLAYLNEDCIYLKEITERIQKEIDIELIHTIPQLRQRFYDISATYSYIPSMGLEIEKIDEKK